MMEEYKPNSHKFKEEQKQLPPEKKKVEKIVTTPAKINKTIMFSMLSMVRL